MIATGPTETIHLYYEQGEEPKTPRSGFDVGVILFSLVCFALLVWRICSIPPTLETVIVPAHFLPIKRFSATITIMPTGVKTYSATYASGVLTVYNGSFLAERIPQGFILTANNGVEVTTDTSVVIPAGNPPNYGMVTVFAHAVISGTKGNISAYAINNIYGASVYVRNLTAFTGGKQEYSVTYITMQDRLKALEKARATLRLLIPQTMLDAPCTESVNDAFVTWVCQYVTYTPPVFFRVVGIEVMGKNLLLIGYFVARSHTTEFK